MVPFPALVIAAISSDTTIILVAAIGLFSAVMASITSLAILKGTAIINAKAKAAEAATTEAQRKEDSKEAERVRKEEWARQDRVAERVEVASQAAHTAAVEAASQMKQVEATTGVIHRLVNSDKTAAMEREVKAARAQILLHKSIIALHATAGNDAPEDHAAIKQLEGDVANLQTELDERHRQDEIVEKQIDEARAQGTPVEPT